MLSRPPVYTMEMLVAIRTCFSGERNPACDRYQRNRTPEAPPYLEDLSGKWRAKGQTRGGTGGVGFWLISETSPAAGRQRQSLTHELTWSAVVERTVLGSLSTPCRDSWMACTEASGRRLLQLGRERSPYTQSLSFQGTCCLLGVCPRELPGAEVLQLLVAGQECCWEASLPPPPRPGLPASEPCRLLWLG